MFINNTYINLPNEEIDISKFPNYYEENEFISNLMLNPQKYRDFKCNINRINNIENEKNYLKSLEKKTHINFLGNIIITEEEYQNSLKDEETIFENLTEERINELLSHKKLLSHEKHLLETMSYILGYENFDWNMFKKVLNLYELKTKMRNIDYTRIKKRRINILLGQLCRSDKFNQFLNMNDFCDSGFEFVYEWVKTQLKIYFYLYQNKKIPKMQISKSMLNIPDYVPHNKLEEINEGLNENINQNINNNYTPYIPEEENDNETINSNMNYNNSKSNRNLLNNNMIMNNNQQKQEIMDSNILKNSTNIETYNNTNKNNNSSNISYNYSKINKSSLINNNITTINRSNSFGNINYYSNDNKTTILLTSLPYIINDKNKNQTYEQSSGFYRKLETLNNISKKSHYFKEARKVSFKLRGFNKEREKLLKEIRTAEMLPLLKNRTFQQMRNYFEDKVPFSRKVEQRMRNDINSLSLNGTQDERKMISNIAKGKMKAFNLESLFKLKNILNS